MALRGIGRTLPGVVRLVVLRGTGGAFSIDPALPPGGPPRDAGARARGGDIPPGEAAERHVAAAQEAVSWLSRPDLISVAAVSGPASGPGTQLALACDLRVIADDASFALPEVGLGLVPYLGGTGTLVAAVGYARALEICLTGRVVDASEAVGLGLAQLRVPADQLADAVSDLIAAVLAAPRAATTELKALLRPAPTAAPVGIAPGVTGPGVIGPGGTASRSATLVAEREATRRCASAQEVE
ncbi:MAG: enoyl-CoA hydratase/isomerase family protein [Frankia sp.]